ncbi:MAG TPA: low molecular weight phosphotyrosine protein phosphatase [Fibrobacter sp.]|nr:low molecular weight phosphotyrosine protein phosphatase [Fibrobacter sp.]
MLKKNILFVCLGNICRSPAGEGIARVLCQDLDSIGKIDSAGLGDWHIGHPPHKTMRRVAAERGFPIDDLKARIVVPEDFNAFDFILAMDQNNLKHLLEMQNRVGGKAQVRMLYDDKTSVPDPYYGPEEGFYESFDIINRGVTLFLRSFSQ